MNKPLEQGTQKHPHLKGNHRPPKEELFDVTPIEPKFLDLAYADVSETQKLDIFLPEMGEGPFPVVLYIHGGAFKMGDKRGGGFKSILSGRERGYAIVTVNYHLSQEAKFPAAVEDVKAAIRFIKANAIKYQLDATKIAVWGGSAGGHLAAMMGVTSHLDLFDNPQLGNMDQSSDVQAVVDWFGPINFLLMDEQFGELGVEPKFGVTGSAGSPESQYIGTCITEVADIVAKSNPETYIHASNPPFFIQHGTADRHIPYLQAIHFSNKLREVLGEEKVYFELIEGAGHGDGLFVDKPYFTTEENLEKVFNFLDSVLK